MSPGAGASLSIQEGGLNHNVKLALWWSLWENVSASVRSGDVLSALLFLLTKSNTTVGVVQGINGVLQMLAALPAGWLADRHRRDTLLRWGAGVGAAAGGVLAYALLAAPSVPWLAAAMALLGCYRGVYNSALEALWADSIPPGRSSLYTKRYALTVLASSFGPWLSLALFALLGNRWHERDCRLVLLAGVALMAVPLALMCCFDDDKALEAPARRQRQAHGGSSSGDSGSGAREPRAAGYAPLPVADSGAKPGDSGGAGSDDMAANDAATSAAAAAGVAAPAAATAATAAAAEAAAAPLQSGLISMSELECGARGAAGQEAEAAPGSGCCACLAPGLVVTLLISFSDFIGALASGMTLKFFALFFIQMLHFTPAAVSLIGALSPLGVAAASLACQPLSKLVGRVQISLVTRCLDILLLVCLAYLPTSGPSASRALLVAVHLVRMAVANATRPLMRSVLMDCVPQRHRGKVNAVDSIRTFSWSGSAAAGGWLIERFGFQTTFLITALIKLGAFLPLFALLAYVPDGVCVPAGTRGARLLRQQQWSRLPRRPAAAQEGGLRQPLLANSRVT